MLYTRKIHLIFSDIRNQILDFKIAALDMMTLEWSHIFRRSQINLPFVISFIFLGDIVETNGHIERSYLRLTAMNTNFENLVEIALVST